MQENNNEMSKEDCAPVTTGVRYRIHQGVNFTVPPPNLRDDNLSPGFPSIDCVKSLIDEHSKKKPLVAISIATYNIHTRAWELN